MASIESTAGLSEEISPDLEQAGFNLLTALKDSDTEESEIVVSSYPVTMRHLTKPFGEGEMKLWFIKDFVNGTLKAAWTERDPNTGIELAYDCEWSLYDPTNRVVEITSINSQDPTLTTNGQVPMTPKHEKILRRRLYESLWDGKPNFNPMRGDYLANSYGLGVEGESG